MADQSQTPDEPEWITDPWSVHDRLRIEGDKYKIRQFLEVSHLQQPAEAADVLVALAGSAHLYMELDRILRASRPSEDYLNYGLGALALSRHDYDDAVRYLSMVKAFRVKRHALSLLTRSHILRGTFIEAAQTIRVLRKCKEYDAQRIGWEVLNLQCILAAEVGEPRKFDKRARSLKLRYPGKWTSAHQRRVTFFRVRCHWHNAIRAVGFVLRKCQAIGGKTQ